MRKPPLTAKVLAGLSAMIDAVYAGDLLLGDLAHATDSIDSARTWVERMLAYRVGREKDRIAEHARSVAESADAHARYAALPLDGGEYADMSAAEREVDDDLEDMSDEEDAIEAAHEEEDRLGFASGSHILDALPFTGAPGESYRFVPRTPLPDCHLPLPAHDEEAP